MTYYIFPKYTYYILPNTHTLQTPPPHTHTHTHYKTHTNTHPHITKPTQTHTHTLQNPHKHTPTHYKTHTNTHPHITKQYKTTTVQIKTNTIYPNEINTTSKTGNQQTYGGLLGFDVDNLVGGYKSLGRMYCIHLQLFCLES